MTSMTRPSEQLTLLPEVDAPLRFRLDEATRWRGLRHVAEIRAQLDRQRAAAPVAERRLDRAAAPVADRRLDRSAA